MANVKITELTAYTNPASTDVVPIVDLVNDQTKKATLATIFQNFPNGTAGAPGISIEGDTNTGIFSPSADQLAISTGGTARLTVSTSAVTSALPVDVLLGSASTPSFTFTGDLDTGIYSPGANQVAISTSGTAALTVDSSQRVGIGDVNPDRKLQVIHSTDALMRLGRSDATSHGSTDVEIKFAKNFYSNAVFEAASHRFEILGTERMRIDSSGRLGIGLTNPSQKLHIQDSSGPLLIFDDATTQFGHVGSYNKLVGSGNIDTFLVSSANSKPLVLRAPTGQTISFDIASNNAMRIDSSGNVGIGTTTVSATLDVRGADNIVVGASPESGNGEGVLFLGCVGTATKGTIIGRSALSFQTSSSSTPVSSGTERMRIDSSGRLLVGTSSAPTGGLPQFSRFTVSLNNDAASNGGQLNLAGNARGSLSTGDALGQLLFTDSTNGTYGSIQCQLDGTPGNGDYPGRLVFSSTPSGSASPVEQLRITSDRYVRLASGTGGIQFNGDTAAANALDDYEEGTWTPVVADASSGGNTGTFAANNSWYRKIGNTVFVFAELYDVNTTGLIAGNIFWVRNLPFNMPSGKVFTGFGQGAPLASQTDLGIPFANATTSTTGFRISYCTTSGAKSALVSDITSGTTDLLLGFIYYI